MHYMFVALVKVDGRSAITEKVISYCESVEQAEALGVAMYCPAGSSVLSCSPATVDGLVRYIHEEEGRTNARIHDAVSKTIGEWTGSLPKKKQTHSKK